MRRAVDLAPESWSLLYRYGVYAEAAGDDATARQAYQAALDLGHDVALIPGWGDSPLRRDLTPPESELSDFAQTLLLLERGEIAAAQSFAARSSRRRDRCHRQPQPETDPRAERGRPRSSGSSLHASQAQCP